MIQTNPISKDSGSESANTHKDTVDAAKIPVVDEMHCVGCGVCIRGCPTGAISLNDNRIAYIDPTKCIGCLTCMSMCPREVILLPQ